VLDQRGCPGVVAIVPATVTAVAATSLSLFIIVIFIVLQRPTTQEAYCCRVFLGRWGIDFFLRGGEVPLPGHIVVIIFIHFPTKEELEIFAVGQGFIIL
jgi:hypothetical protein